MQRPIDYKQCPVCGLAAGLPEPRCPRCGHVYSTQFVPPNQTQAFMPGGQPVPGYPRQNPYGYQAQDQIAAILLSIPPIVCFILGFVTNLIAILLLIGYFGYEPAKDSRRGWATAWGMISSGALGLLMFVLSIVLSFSHPLPGKH